MKAIFASVLMVMVVFAVGGINILGRVHLFEPVKAGESLELLVNIHNPTSHSLDALKVRAVFLDWGGYTLTHDFELESGETSGVQLLADIPQDVPAGDHLVKIVASNDDYYDSKFVYVRVI